MKSQPQNTEFRNNPENFHPCILRFVIKVSRTCIVGIIVIYVFILPFSLQGLNIDSN